MSQPLQNNWSISIRSTEILKGIAIVAMLMHHLWGCHPEWIAYTGAMGLFGHIGKVCVAMFLFCSGYGLSVGYSKVMEDCRLNNGDRKNRIKTTLKFLAKRFVKFYSGYWPIFLIFVPIGVFVFHIPLENRYESPYVMWNLLRDFFATKGYMAYNITWWFNSLILLLYFAFPILYYLTKKIGIGMIVLSMVYMRLEFHLPFYINPVNMCLSLLPFVCGIFWCIKQDKLITLKIWLNSHVWMFRIISLIILGFALCLRIYPIIPHWGGIRLDAFVVVGLILCVLAFDGILSGVSKIFSFCGKNSANMYMTHTFFFSYWFSSFFYSRELGGG